MKEIVVADIGGTHARFALAELDGSKVVSVGEPAVLKTAAYPSLEAAWRAFGDQLGRPLPTAAGVAVATPVGGETLKMTNNPWIIRPAVLREQLAPEGVLMVNDFGALAHAVGQLGPEHFDLVCGPDTAAPAEGVTTVMGPGTGLGVAQLVRRPDRNIVVETEGGHIDFAPLDHVEEQILGFLRERYGRVSVERILSGPGLANIYTAIGSAEGLAASPREDNALWASAFDGSDALAARALDRFCLSFGAVAGDIALVQGADAVALTGGLTGRIGSRLAHSGFGERFLAKGRFKERMMRIPVRMITHPQPGLFGAAVAYATEHPQ